VNLRGKILREVRDEWTRNGRDYLEDDLEFWREINRRMAEHEALSNQLALPLEPSPDQP
jgi:hypothetical protein